MVNLKGVKFYYRFLELFFLHQIKKNNLDDAFKNCFIYFDYEREFGGIKTNISDTDIEYILDHLDEVQIKTTWFTVGKILESYPETVSKILERGHEIGSHTYAHVSPKEMNRSTMDKDFINFERSKGNKDFSVEGFHSPKSQWSISMFNFLLKNKFSYDVISLFFKSQKILPMKLKLLESNPIVRLVSVGDDWPLFKANKSRLEVFEYFKKLYFKTKKGDIFGIGFHPWILISDQNILLGYKDFLNYITQEKDLIIKPAIFFARAINNT